MKEFPSHSRAMYLKREELKSEQYISPWNKDSVAFNFKEKTGNIYVGNR